MIKTITLLTRWLANSLYSIVSWLESKGASAGMQSKFVDLAPTDEADKAGVYSEAILFATNNSKVSNIALTGPYGSGKSSIIQSFLKKYRRPALHISLAAFVPETDTLNGKVTRQEIERSILQQMLYGADANKLPLSRFKRIHRPSVWSAFKSLYIMIGGLATWYIFTQREEIISGTFFAPLSVTNWFNFGILFFAATFIWVTLHHFYVASFGLSLKSISLKDVEIRPAFDDQTSILNRHLDEIVYFFQSTNYDLVIIEDLDRFNNADIFVTLREINSLVNENAGVKRTIRFLYALRDDMFVNTDRTKFFEFIIPVIPIINTSNSIDMVLQQGKRLKLDERLDRQFLREVSRYLNDLRLIQNIFNEYAIYVANLETDGESLLDANKLLAILIYKNVYPRDFEQLHRGVGTLAEILNRQDELVRHGEAKYRIEIAELEKRLELAERQIPTDIRELRHIYAMALIEKLPANAVGVSLDQRTWISLPQLVGHNTFEQIIESPRLISRTPSQQIQVDISKLQDEVDSQKSYQQRKKEIEDKSDENKIRVSRQVRDIRSKISALRMTKLNELLRLDADRVQDLFKTLGKNGDLARFLVLEGYLDDTYYHYTSLFHSGRLSPNDNKFLIQIRAFVTPEPSFPIDNPKEVIAAMRDEDFQQSYALNVKLVDTLLSNESIYLEKTRKFFDFLSSRFESCEDFFDAYYTSGHDVTGLLSRLVNTWRGLIPAVISSPRNISHVTQLASNLPEESLEALTNNFKELPEFVSDNLPEILLNSPELTPERLECFDFEIKDLVAIKEHPRILRAMFEKGLFEVTIENLEYIYESVLGGNDLASLRERNFTTIRSMNNAALTDRVERDFGGYLCNVLLELEGNSKEDSHAILAVLQHDMLDQDDIRKFLERQTTLLSTLEDAPERLHSILFQTGKIEPTWSNCLKFMDIEGFEEESLIDYLDRDTVRAAILKRPIPSGSNSLELRELLLNANALSDISYKDYMQAFPSTFDKFPIGLDPSKLRILVDERKIIFTKESLETLSHSRDLQILFVAKNIDKYLIEPEIFSLDDEFRESLLRSRIDDAAKIKIVGLMDLSSLAGRPELSALIGKILVKTDASVPSINASIAQSLIAHSTPIETRISLLNKYHSLLQDDEVRHVLSNLPKPYSEIQTGHSTPRLKNTPENRKLVGWLDSRKIISSWTEGRFFSDDIKVNLFRR